MTGVAGDFAQIYSSHLEAPPQFFYMAFLTCLGSILSGRLTLASEVSPQPRLYVILLGQSADDRKSTAINKVVEFFEEFPEFSICRGVGSAEGLLRMLQESSNLLLCLDEFKQFVGKCKISSSVLLPCVATLFEENRYETATKNSAVNLEDAHLSLLAATTVETYERSWDSSFTDIGFNNRLFLVPGRGKKRFSLPQRIPEAKIISLRERVTEILRYVGSGLELELSETARKHYEEWYENLERSIHAKRIDTYAMRLMALLAANDLIAEVNLKTVLKVIELCEWQLHVRRDLDPIDADNKIAKMEEKIRRKLKQRPLKDYELKQLVNANKAGLWFYNTAKRNLQNEIRFNLKSKTLEYIGF